MILANHGIISSSGGVLYDADALAFITSASITDNTQKTAINTLVTDLKTYNIWSKMKAIYPFVGGVVSSHVYNLKDPRDLNAAYRLVFSGGWTHSSNGALPNGTTGYANTFLSPNSRLNLTSNHFSYYSRSNVAAAQQIEMGVADNLAETPLIAFSIRFTGDIYRYFNPDYNVTNISTSNTDSRGFYVGSRTANNSHKTFKNGTQQGVNTTTITQSTLPSSNLYIGVYNFAPGAPAAYSSKEAAFASIGDGLTDTEAAAFYNAVQTYQTTLSRNV